MHPQQGLSQTELAKAVGVHYNHIGRYERSQSKPSAETLSRLAGALGVSGDFLMEGRADEAAKAAFEDRELLMQLNKTHPELRVNFLEYWEIRKGKQRIWSWVTDLQLRRDTVESLVRGGRADGK